MEYGYTAAVAAAIHDGILVNSFQNTHQQQSLSTFQFARNFSVSATQFIQQNQLHQMEYMVEFTLHHALHAFYDVPKSHRYIVLYIIRLHSIYFMNKYIFDWYLLFSQQQKKKRKWNTRTQTSITCATTTIYLLADGAWKSPHHAAPVSIYVYLKWHETFSHLMLQSDRVGEFYYYRAARLIYVCHWLGMNQK